MGGKERGEKKGEKRKKIEVPKGSRNPEGAFKLLFPEGQPPAGGGARQPAKNSQNNYLQKKLKKFTKQ